MLFGLWFNVIFSKQLLKEWLWSCTTKTFLVLSIVNFYMSKAKNVVHSKLEVPRPYTE